MSNLVDHIITKRGYTLIGDSRGIVVPSTQRQQVYQWAAQNKIIVEFKGNLSGLDLWYVKDDDHRSWFALKWK